MKYIPTITLILCTLTSLHSQTHEVIFTKDNIRLQRNNRVLKKDSQFKKQDKLNFNNMEAFLITEEKNTQKNYLIQPQRNRQNQVVAKFQLLPYSIKNRPGYILSGVDLVNYLNEGENYLVIGKETIIPINKNGFSMNQDTFFYVHYDYHGFSINKKLPIVEEGGVVNRDSLFRVRFTLEEYYRQILGDTKKVLNTPNRDTFLNVNPAQIAVDTNQYMNFKNAKFDTVTYLTNMELHHFDEIKRKDLPISAPVHPGASTLVARDFLPFNLVFLEDEEVMAVLAPLLESDFFANKEDAVERLTAFLEEGFGGKLEEGDLEPWLEEKEFLERF